MYLQTLRVQCRKLLHRRFSFLWQKRARSCRKYMVRTWLSWPVLVLKKYRGKTNFFVANQASIDSVPAEELTKLEVECKAMEESNNGLVAEVRAITAGKAIEYETIHSY